MTTRALVLAGGGLAGIAWELGVLRGIADVDPGHAKRLLAADVIVGTSAGSSVADQITGGTSLDDLYAGQLADTPGELAPDVDLVALLQRFAVAAEGATSASEVRRRIATVALETETVDETAASRASAAGSGPSTGRRVAAQIGSFWG